MDPFLLTDAPVETIDDYLGSEVGGRGFEALDRLGVDAVLEEITASGLRGRGGGGFPTGRKWAGIKGSGTGRRFVVVNGAEGEPGTFKDRALLRSNPFPMVEGAMVAARVVGAEGIYVCVKGTYERERARVLEAAEGLQNAGFCPDLSITVVAGPDEYLFGEEKAMLEVIEGKSPLPRLLAPYEQGLFADAPQSGWEAAPHGGTRAGESNPTLVNNVETLSNVPHILARGPAWFRSMGTDGSPGSILATVVGDVATAAVGEVEMGTTLREVIDRVGGGPAGDHPVKAVFSGAANAVITGADLDVPLTYEGFQAIGSGLGSAGFIVYDDTACMVNAAYLLSRFLSIESCGQCPPCKLGSQEITTRLERLETGTGTDDDVAEIAGWLPRVTDGNRCYLAVEERVMVGSVLEAFPDEIAEHVAGTSCPRPRDLPIPKLVDIADGVASYDERFWRKRPDWTYDPD